MSKSTAILPIARTWRDIPQQVSSRAMSREGKRRLALHGLRVIGGMTALAIAVAAAWEVVTVLRPDPATPSLPAARALPIGDNVEPITDGVLDKAWLRRALALPSTATLANIDPSALRLRVLAGGQVKEADFFRHFPRTLAVHMAERTPVARLMVQSAGGTRRQYLIARDGVVYEGRGYDPEMIKTLPWLDGVHPQPGGPGLATIAGMEGVADFLANASSYDQDIYRTWQVVSLARFETDGLIEVRTAAGTKILFNTRGDSLYYQVARLNTVNETLAGTVPASAVKEINLSLGLRVPVAIAPVDGWSATSGRAGPDRVQDPELIKRTRSVRSTSDDSGASPSLPPIPKFNIYP